VDISESEQGCRIGATFNQRCRGAALWDFRTYSFFIVLFKSWWTTREPQFLEKVICFSKYSKNMCQRRPFNNFNV